MIVVIIFLTRLAIILVTILQSTFNKLIGRQLSSAVISLFCLGINVVILCFCSSVRETDSNE